MKLIEIKIIFFWACLLLPFLAMVFIRRSGSKLNWRAFLREDFFGICLSNIWNLGLAIIWFFVFAKLYCWLFDFDYYYIFFKIQ